MAKSSNIEYLLAECGVCQEKLGSVAYRKDNDKLTVVHMIMFITYIPLVCPKCNYFICQDCIQVNNLSSCLCDTKLMEYSEYYSTYTKNDTKIGT